MTYRWLIILISLLITVLYCRGQDQASGKIDSIRGLISVAQTDSGKINLLNALAAEYSLISIDSSVAIAKRTIAIAEKIDYPRGVIEAYHSVSNGFIRRYQKLLEEDTDIINSQRNIVLVFIVLCISLFFLLYNRFQLRQHTNYQIEINRHRNEIFTTSVTIQDKERKRIAEDLHDSLSSMLSTVKLNLERMDEEGLVLTESQLGKYHLALEVLNDSITEVRNISHNLMPASLSKLGLIPALKNLFDNLISHSDLKISFNTHDFEERFNEAAEISIYRIILELVTNTVKHAQASELNVQIIKYPAYINIIVEDNGKGFNWKKAKTGQGIGLTNIESRIELLKGKLEIDSGSGGTTVVIEIPIDEIKTNG